MMRFVLVSFVWLLACGAQAGGGLASQTGRDAEPGATTGSTQEGLASYYSDSLTGRSTASGEPYRPERLTAAHRTLRFGTCLRVTRLDDRSVVEVRVNDRGPFGRQERIIDLSRAAAERLHMIRDGVIRVQIEPIACE